MPGWWNGRHAWFRTMCPQGCGGSSPLLGTKSNMNPIFVGVAGGTGAGKSTLCTMLIDKYPAKIGLIQLDDYFKPSVEVSKFKGRTNWDHPNALYLDNLANDLAELLHGKSVLINTKNERLNPGYKKTSRRIPVKFQPKPIMLVEGYLVLYDERVRKLLNTSIWLDAEHEARWRRRVHFKYPKYEKEVLLPMYKQFAEPTKQHAQHIIDVSYLSKEQVLKEVEQLLKNYL